MARRLSAVNRTFLSNLSPSSPLPNPNPNPNLCTASSGAAAAAASILPFLSCKRRKKLRKKIASPRVAPIQREPSLRVDALDVALDRDAAFRFLNRARSFLARLPSAPSPSPPRAPSSASSASPAAARSPATPSATPSSSTSPASPGLPLFDALEPRRVQAVRKLLMLSARRRVPLAKLHHCRGVLGLPDDFRDRVRKYPDCFRVAVDPDGRHVLELARWDPALAVSALERSFVADESRARRTFKFPLPHRKALPLDEDDAQRLDSLTTLPLISPYSDGSTLTPWSVDAEKYRVGIIHEFLSLTLEKRASIHHIVEFKEEFSLTRHTYQMLLKQPRAFYLAGTEMNWTVFLRDAYGDDGALIDKDPQVLFNEKLERYASCTAESDPE
uniref:PORR domain-containing protein n=1 Tax=Ananas comosus var. bracteatus TaxID=296719 RepID=A0A6V7P6L2_ANACO|nr:unnamed protein product [Ananas comosus var. bracteatus]